MKFLSECNDYKLKTEISLYLYQDMIDHSFLFFTFRTATAHPLNRFQRDK